MQLLQALHEQLRHFNDSPDFGEAEAVAVIRRHLLLRIREVEASLRTPVRFETERTRACSSEAA